VVDFEQLVAELEQRLDSLVSEVLRRLLEKAPSGELHSSAWERLVDASLRTELRCFRLDSLPASVKLVDAAEVSEIAELTGLELLLSAHRLCQATLWENWFSLVEETGGLNPAARRQLLARGSDFFFRYGDLLGDAVAEAYRQALESSSQDSKRRRLRAIRLVLTGQAADPAANDLNFDLDQHHLGAIAWGEEAARSIRDLASLLERPSLLTGPLDGVVWSWISGSRPFGPGDERVLAHFRPPQGAAIAIGQPDYGEEGFRATHHQAQRARWASRFSEQPIIRYADVALVALAAENREEARRFVARELDGIDDDSAKSREIRETLIAYFDAEHNAASAAARLGIHQQTVANRIRAVEERIGRPVGTRRVELEVALRLRASFAGVDT
jgi:hypothetical protein